MFNLIVCHKHTMIYINKINISKLGSASNKKYIRFNIRCKNDDRTPLIFIEVDANNAIISMQIDTTVLFHGHFDKQPPLTDEW